MDSLAKHLPKHSWLESRKDQKKDYTKAQCEAPQEQFQWDFHGILI